MTGVEFTKAVESRIGTIQPGVVGDAIYFDETRDDDGVLRCLVRVGRETLRVPQDAVKPISWKSADHVSAFIRDGEIASLSDGEEF